MIHVKSPNNKIYNITSKERFPNISQKKSVDNALKGSMGSASLQIMWRCEEQSHIFKFLKWLTGEFCGQTSRRVD